MSHQQEEPHTTDAAHTEAPSASADGATPDKTPYYVIVGCGTAAVVNHVTLRRTNWGRRRIGDLPVMHIGFEDPWGHYQNHRMGQNPHLLCMPGYENCPGPNEDPAQPRESRLFADDTAREFKRLGREHPFKIKRGFVALIQPRGVGISDLSPESVTALDEEGIDLSPLANPDDFPDGVPYRLLVVNQQGQSELVYAHKIDICTGMGRPRGLKDFVKDVYDVMGVHVSTPGLSDDEERGPAQWQPPETWAAAANPRRVVSGTEALYAETVWEEGQRVCVMGEGGVAVNMIERGEKAGVWLDWITKQMLPTSSFENPRNHTVLKKSGGGRMACDEFEEWRDNDSACIPAYQQGRIAVDTVVIRVRPEGAQEIEVVFREYDPSDKQAPRVSAYYASQHPHAVIRDFCEIVTPLDNHGCYAYSARLSAGLSVPPRAGIYHRLILCCGQDGATVGQPSQVVELFRRQFRALFANGSAGAFADAQHLVGLCTNDDDMRVRVLGAAAHSNRNWVNRPGNAAEGAYRVTLPRQAQIAGFTFCGVSIALANRYFEEYESRNFNTMTPAQMDKAVGNTLSNIIMFLRGISVSGFAVKRDLERLLSTWPECVPTKFQSRLIDYPDRVPDGWREKLSDLTPTY